MALNKIKFLLPAVFGLLLAQYSYADLGDGLLAYYTLDGNANDSSGNGYDLTLAGSPSFSGTGPFGGSALMLDGSGTQYATRPVDDAAFNFGSSDFTVQIWADFAQTGSEQTLIEKFSGAAGPGWSLTTPAGNCDTQFYSQPAVQVDAGGCLPANQWLQFVVERSGSSLDLFIDGNLVASGTVSGSLSSSPNPLLIGTRDSGDGRNFNVDGALADAGIWDRALSLDEIDALYNGASPVPEPSSAMAIGIGLIGLAIAVRKKLPR